MNAPSAAGAALADTPSAPAPSRAEHAAAMAAYCREGEARAAAIGNRGPVRFGPDGKLHPDILDAYWQHGFYIFEGAVDVAEIEDLRRDMEMMLERAPVDRDATVDARGRIRLVDRTKDLIKSGGEWISSVELENELMAHPKISEAAVIGVPHPRWSERPLACVVVAPGEDLTRDDVVAYLTDKVAKWQLPDDVVFIDEVPKTSVGKFSKKTLRDRFATHDLPTS